MPRPTTAELAKRLDRIDAKYERKVESMEETQKTFRHEMRKEYALFKEWVRTEVDKFHEYLKLQEGYEKGLKDAAINTQIKSGDIRISKEAWWLIVKIVGFIGTALAIILGALNGQ